MENINSLLESIDKQNKKIGNLLTDITARNEALIKIFDDFEPEKEILQNILNDSSILRQRYPESEYKKIDITEDQYMMLEEILMKQSEICQCFIQLDCLYSKINHYPKHIKSLLNNLTTKDIEDIE